MIKKDNISYLLSKIPKKIENIYPNAEEIRIRLNKDIAIKSFQKEIQLKNTKINQDDMDYILNSFTKYSLYSSINEISQGFFTDKYGNRLGICGEVVNAENKIIKNISSINIRIASEHIGISNDMINSILNKNIIIFSPPGIGKTSLLRDIIRNIANKGFSVSVADTRGEISASNYFDTGFSSDVMTGGNKENSIFMLLKTMSPLYIATDEISSNTKILEHIKNTGAKIIATIHCDEYNLLAKDIKSFFDIAIEIKIFNNKRCYNLIEVEND